MQQFITTLDFSVLLNTDVLLQLVKGIAVLFGGLIAVRVLVYFINRYLLVRANDQIRLLIDKTVRILGMTTVIILALTTFGVNPTPLLGAAGIVGVALSIASQNSLANIVSGLFLISEKPFMVGDLIRVSDKLGVVHSIDLLSVKVRTLDNQYIRIPSEKILNSEVTNITRFPIRRQEFTLFLPYATDLNEITTILQSINDENIHCLNEPSPLVLFQEIGAGGIKVLFGVWFVKTDYVVTRNSVIEMIQRRFAERGIQFQVPLFQAIGSPSGPGTGPSSPPLRGFQELEGTYLAGAPSDPIKPRPDAKA